MISSITSAYVRRRLGGAWAVVGLALLASVAPARAQVWTRAVGIIASGSPVAGKAVAVDATGNTYVAGEFVAPSFSLGGVTLQNANQGTPFTSDVFVVKYSPSGAVLWATRLGGPANDNAAALTVDAGGNAYVAGNFFGSMTVGSTTFASAGGADMFAARLASATGAPDWAVRAGGPQSDNATGLSLNNAGFLWLAGNYQGTATISGVSVPTSTTLTSAGGFDMALIKFSNGNGAYIRSASVGGTGNDYVQAIASNVDDFYVAGYFESSSLPAGGTTLTRRCALRDAVLLKYDQFTTLAWARSEGASGATSCAYYALNADGSSVATVGGEYQGTVTVGNFDTVTNPASVPAPLFATYAPAGNVTRARGGANGGLATGRVTGVARDASGNTYASGYFSGRTQWTIVDATSAGANDVFVVKFPASGPAQWISRAGGSGDDVAAAMTSNGIGQLTLVGTYNSTLTFGTQPVLTPGAGSAFVAQLNGTALGVRAGAGVAALEAWPNPVGADRTLRLSLPVAPHAGGGAATLRLLDVLGRTAHEQPLPAAVAQPLLALPNALAPGRYVAEVQADGQLLRQVLVVQ